MAKEFYTEGTGSNQTLHSSQDEKIPIYDDINAVEADLANLEVGQVVATKDEGLTENITDAVQDGNMNAVTSNAVFDYITLDYSTLVITTGADFIATKHTRMVYLLGSSSNQTVSINGNIVSVMDNLPDGQWVIQAIVDLFPGDVVVFSQQGGRLQLIDYKA